MRTYNGTKTMKHLGDPADAVCDCCGQLVYARPVYDCHGTYCGLDCWRQDATTRSILTCGSTWNDPLVLDVA